MKIRIERISTDALKIHRLYGEGASINEINRPQADQLISLLSFEKLESHLKGDNSMIVDVPDPMMKPRSKHTVPAHLPDDSDE